MRIIVCIKQVPEVSEVRINPETKTLMREGVPSIVNPYDLHAVEAGLQLKEKLGGTVTAITMGPPQAEEALREVISMGVDQAYLISDRAFAGSDTWATAYTLAAAAKHLGFDLIICGKQAIDGDTAQVGPEMAEFLRIPHVAYVKAIESATEDKLVVHRMMEEGYDVVEMPLPGLITVVKELNKPRLPSLKGKMRAKKEEIKVLNRETLQLQEEMVGLSGSPTQVKEIFAPERKKDRKIFEGPPEAQVEALVNELKRLNLI
ncbi:MAG: electron transfer flavoprotein subunit beta/FixA family protein [Nitrospirae bacterium]|nr:MAG: electron transfer flavoprotein subunit beta/FixA family protein [Nitrospirota bacterium]